MFEGVMGMLIRKGLLREDPYNYEQAFTDITIPKDDVLPEFENSDEVSYRLAAFRRQLKFVCAEYPLDLPTLGLARLKKLSSLVSYINWLEMGEASKSPTTKAFARVFMKVRMGSDTMASQILKDSETQIIKTTHTLRTLLAELIAFDRESWKAEIRRTRAPHTLSRACRGSCTARRNDSCQSSGALPPGCPGSPGIPRSWRRSPTRSSRKTRKRGGRSCWRPLPSPHRRRRKL